MRSLEKEKLDMSFGQYGGGSRRYDSGPREMHKIKCSDCGNESEVPFKPTEGRPVYCRDCFQKHRPPRRDTF
jgi:CxxC-x17-CxxC domain-containing protein